MRQRVNCANLDERGDPNASAEVVRGPTLWLRCHPCGGAKTLPKREPINVCTHHRGSSSEMLKLAEVKKSDIVYDLGVVMAVL